MVHCDCIWYTFWAKLIIVDYDWLKIFHYFQKPYLEVQVKGSSRHKRYQPTPQCKTANKKKRCCRYPLIVDFVAMEWDWILAPKQYKAYYCYGKCPFAYYRPYPHTHVITQSEVNDFIPCCTPTELNSLLLFYRNEEQTIIYGTIPGMIVESCGCIWCFLCYTYNEKHF